jgi:hypothetical protein
MRAGSPLTENDRETAARWYLTYSAFTDPVFGRRYRRASAQTIRRWIDYNRGYLQFADSAPEITAAYGAGRCLWISGWAPEDYIDGTALTWIGIDVEHANLLKIVRIPRIGSRVRHVSGQYFYTSHRDSRGREFVERYPHGVLNC